MGINNDLVTHSKYVICMFFRLLLAAEIQHSGFKWMQRFITLLGRKKGRYFVDY
jgi:hypothetical protein